MLCSVRQNGIICFCEDYDIYNNRMSQSETVDTQEKPFSLFLLLLLFLFKLTMHTELEYIHGTFINSRMTRLLFSLFFLFFFFCCCSFQFHWFFFSPLKIPFIVALSYALQRAVLFHHDPINSCVDSSVLISITYVATTTLKAPRKSVLIVCGL